MFIKQIRQKIGVTFGNGEVTTGGNALKFYSSIRLEIRRIGAIKRSDSILGNRTRIKVVKNKLAPPFRTVLVDVYYGQGICRAAELLNRAEKEGVLTRSGSWYALGEERLANGREALRDRLLESSELMSRLTALLDTPSASVEVK